MYGIAVWMNELLNQNCNYNLNMMRFLSPVIMARRAIRSVEQIRGCNHCPVGAKHLRM
jgi:hypothetical protein